MRSIQRWKAEGDPQRAKHIEFAQGFLEDHGDDVGLEARTIQQLFVAAPRIFEFPFTDQGVAVQSPAGDTALGDDVCSINGLPRCQDCWRRKSCGWADANPG